MFIALDKNNNLIDIQNTIKNEEYFCKFCKEKVIVKAKNSIHKAPHFCHRKNSDCVEEWAQHDMSEWHKNWQNYFPLDNREVIVKDESVKHIADVLINKTVIEFQYSPISYKNFNNRNQFYTKLGYAVIWVFDANGKIIFNEKEKCYQWINVQNQFEGFNNQVLVFLELNNNGIPLLFIPKQVTPTKIVCNNGFYSNFFSRESFLKTFGIRVSENILSIPEWEKVYNKQIQHYVNQQRLNYLVNPYIPVSTGAKIDNLISNQSYNKRQNQKSCRYNRYRNSKRK